jgi:hypothetical protein
MWLFVWDSEPSKIFVGDTAISKCFLWDTQIRPSGWGGWQPWANTLLYLPLESDIVDKSWKTWRTFTEYAWNTYTTVWWVASYHMGTTWWFKITQPYPFQPDNTKPLTFSFLFYLTTIQSSSRRLIADRWTTNYNRIWFAIRENTSNIEFAIDYNDTNTVDLKSSIPSANAWHHAVFTCSTTAAKMYIDWALTDSSSGVANPRWRRQYWHDNTQWMFCSRDVNDYTSALDWNAREVIFEEVEWTAQEVADYYTRIKTKLWI